VRIRREPKLIFRFQADLVFDDVDSDLHRERVVASGSRQYRFYCINDIFAAETTAFHTTPDCFLPIVRAKANLYPGGSPVQL
jgi:hypothetical protein